MQPLPDLEAQLGEHGCRIIDRSGHFRMRSLETFNGGNQGVCAGRLFVGFGAILLVGGLRSQLGSFLLQVCRKLQESCPCGFGKPLSLLYYGPKFVEMLLYHEWSLTGPYARGNGFYDTTWERNPAYLVRERYHFHWRGVPAGSNFTALATSQLARRMPPKPSWVFIREGMLVPCNP